MKTNKKGVIFMKTIDKVILENGKTYDFSPNKKELYLTFLENKKFGKICIFA